MVNVLLSYQRGNKKSLSDEVSWIRRALLLAELSAAEGWLRGVGDHHSRKMRFISSDE